MNEEFDLQPLPGPIQFLARQMAERGVTVRDYKQARSELPVDEFWELPPLETDVTDNRGYTARAAFRRRTAVPVRLLNATLAAYRTSARAVNPTLAMSRAFVEMDEYLRPEWSKLYYTLQLKDTLDGAVSEVAQIALETAAFVRDIAQAVVFYSERDATYLAQTPLGNVGILKGVPVGFEGRHEVMKGKQLKHLLMSPRKVYGQSIWPTAVRLHSILRTHKLYLETPEYHRHVVGIYGAWTQRSVGSYVPVSELDWNLSSQVTDLRIVTELQHGEAVVAKHKEKLEALQVLESRVAVYDSALSVMMSDLSDAQRLNTVKEIICAEVLSYNQFCKHVWDLKHKSVLLSEKEFNKCLSNLQVLRANAARHAAAMRERISA